MSDLPDGEGEDLGEIEEIETDGEADEGLDAGDDAEGDERPEGQEGDVDPPQAPRGRAQRRITSLSGRVQDLERQLSEANRQRAQPQQPQPDPAAQRAAQAALFERWAQMAPHEAEVERQEYYRRQFGGQMDRIAGQLGDQMDRTSFEARCATSKARERLAPRVEEVIAQRRQMGDFGTTREVAFKYLLGEEVDRKTGEATVRQRREGQNRIRSQTTRPGSARGDAPRSRRPADDSYEAAVERTRGQPL
jgi:hypothetical protein